jgi:hypothetical protein
LALTNTSTVKLGYEELGDNKHSAIPNENIYFVGSRPFYGKFSWQQQ